MSTPSKHKTVQARILKYAKEIGCTVVPREEAEERRGLKERERGLSSPRPSGKHGGQECPPSLFFDDLLDAKIGKSRTF
jgi:type I restriction enzyme R subunit